jgi:metallo-beta-lactamase family protein
LVIISASGMATGGRLLCPPKALAPDARNRIVFAGFQVGGSRGAHRVAGDKSVKVHGEYLPVRAPVSAPASSSGHANADELLAWMRQLPSAPQQSFVVHGEPDAPARCGCAAKTGRAGRRGCCNWAKP